MNFFSGNFLCCKERETQFIYKRFENELAFDTLSILLLNRKMIHHLKNKTYLEFLPIVKSFLTIINEVIIHK